MAEVKEKSKELAKAGLGKVKGAGSGFMTFIISDISSNRYSSSGLSILEIGSPFNLLLNI